MPNIQDYQSTLMPTWCPGCGNFAIWSALKQVLVELNISPDQVVLCFDIGCNGNMADKIKAYGFKGLHGRVIPIASGISIANPNIPIIAIAGDGGTFNEGMQHFIHAIRSNYNITFIVHDNCDFGLTTGQATPTTPVGTSMNSSPYGTIEKTLNPIQLALSAGADFVARGFSGNIKQMKDITTSAIKHKGFSYIDILQHCPTYNNFKDHKWLGQRVFEIDKNSQPQTRLEAIKISEDTDEKIATGIIFQQQSDSFLDKIKKNNSFTNKKYSFDKSLNQFI